MPSPHPTPLTTPLPNSIKIPLPPLKPLIQHHITLPPPPTPKLREPLPEILQLPSPDQTQRDNQNHERESSGPEDPLIDSHVPHVEGVHP